MYEHFTSFDKRKQLASLTASLPVEFHTPTIDKLTILADFKYYEKTMLEMQGHPDMMENPRIDHSMHYAYRLSLASDFFIQIAHPTETNVQNLRIEFNPNKCNPIDSIFHFLLPRIRNKRISRVDYAIDYPFSLAEWQPTTERPRKMCRYHSPTGQSETTYLGSPNSGNQYRIYDKVAEQLANNLVPDHPVHWRIEQQFNLTKNQETWMLRPFEDLILWKPDSYTGNFIDDAILDKLYEDPHNWSRLTSHQRRKYRAIIKDHDRVEHPPIHPVTTFQHGKQPLEAFITALLA